MPIPFTCPHCGKTMTVDDKFAGQTGPCANCQRSISIPYSTGGPAPNGGVGLGGIGAMVGVGVVCVLGCLLVGGVVAVLLVPMGFHSEASANSQSINNLKQIMLAMHNYHDQQGQFPPAVVTDADGKPLYSWRVLLLPYLEHAPLYSQFDKSKAWDDPANIAISRQMLQVYRSPNDATLAPDGVSYFVLAGANTTFPPDKSISLAAITDGTSNTIGVVELKGISGSWAAPIDPRIESLALSIGPSPGQLNPSSSRGLNVAFCDGSVRPLPADTPPATLQLLFTRNDGMPVQVP